MKDEKGSVAKWSYDTWSGIKGSRIVLRARKLGKPVLLQGSGSHKIQQVSGTENAEAWIEIPLRSVADAVPKPARS